MRDGPPSLTADPRQAAESIIYRHVRVVDECKSGSVDLSEDCFLTATHRGGSRAARLSETVRPSARDIRNLAAGLPCAGSRIACGVPVRQRFRSDNPRGLETLRSCIDRLAGNKTGMSGSVRGALPCPRYSVCRSRPPSSRPTFGRTTSSWVSSRTVACCGAFADKRSDPRDAASGWPGCGAPARSWRQRGRASRSSFPLSSP